MVDPLPCPCCGNAILYVGVMSSDSMGVHCQRGWDDEVRERPEYQGCGLKLTETIPADYPDDFPDELVGREAVDKLREMTLEETIRRWNQRTGTESCTSSSSS